MCRENPPRQVDFERFLAPGAQALGQQGKIFPRLAARTALVGVLGQVGRSDQPCGAEVVLQAVLKFRAIHKVATLEVISGTMARRCRWPASSSRARRSQV